MKAVQFILALHAAVFSQLALAHQGHHEHHSVAQALIHHVSSLYHSLMSLAVLGAVMLVLGFVLSLKKAHGKQAPKLSLQRVAGVLLSVTGAGLLASGL